MDHYLSHFEPLKENKTFHHTETDNNNIHGNLLSPGFPCHSCSADENKDNSKFIKPQCGKLYWVRYEFQCEKSGTTIKLLTTMIIRSIYIFESCLKWSKYKYMLNASIRINVNNIVEELPFPDMTWRGNQWKLDSELYFSSFTTSLSYLFDICLNQARLVGQIRAGGGCVRVGGTV